MASQSITDAMQKLCDEFSKALKISQDSSFSKIDSTKGVSEFFKEFRLVLIQDIELNFQHVALLVNRVGVEYENYPRLIFDFIDKVPKQVSVSVSNVYISRATNKNENLVFTKTVFLYTDEFDVDEKYVASLFAQHGLNLIMRDKKYWIEYMNTKMPDAFICHDSRDKEKFVRPLVNELSKHLVKVWYDEFSLSVGDSLIDKIDEGLRQCRFGIIVISENFLTRKKWSNREFRSMTTKEIDAGKKVILPIWLGVTRDQVAEYSLDLADKFALNYEEGIQKITEKLVTEISRGVE